MRPGGDAHGRRVPYRRTMPVVAAAVSANRAAGGPSDGCPRTRRIDLVIVAVTLVVQVGGAILLRNHDPGRHLDLAGLLLVGAGPVLLWWRRRYPIGVLLSIFAVTLTYDLTRHPRGPIFFALSIAFFTCVLARRRLIAWSVLVGGFLLFLGPGHAVGEHPPPQELAGLLAWMLVLGCGSEAIRAARDHHLELNHARDEHARRRATEERLAIARDLHDVLAHHVALISVQSGVALHLLDDHPEQARPALTAIREASSDVLRELRGVLELLRAGDAVGRQPSPGLGRIDDLVTSAGLAGVRVRRESTGQPVDVPEVVGLAAYRIVQEALTNVVRHAGANAATVRLEFGADELVVQVDDDGRGPKPAALAVGGSGLRGMRERVAALQGRLDAGAGPDGGFRVRATLPLAGSSRRP
jgi:signal transduction histidine kinase